jgi:hypothetical protein
MWTVNSLKDHESTRKKTLHEKVHENGAFFVFTVTSESLSLPRESRLKLMIFEKSVYYNENMNAVKIRHTQ